MVDGDTDGECHLLGDARLLQLLRVEAAPKADLGVVLLHHTYTKANIKTRQHRQVHAKTKSQRETDRLGASKRKKGGTVKWTTPRATHEMAVPVERGSSGVEPGASGTMG